MVGIVVVSHSRALADAAVALARQMLHGRDVPIAVAAGLDETTRGYVERLEGMYDEQRLPSGDDLISDIERFLRDQGGNTPGGLVN